mgnify:FL=1
MRDWAYSDVGVDKNNLNYIIDNKEKAKKDKATKDDVQKRMLEEKRNVLMNKQQLELIPYASRKFDKFNSSLIHKVFPYVDTLLEEIFSADRQYVIFCSKIFEEVFEAYNEYNEQKNRNINVNSIHHATQLPGLSNKVSCCILNINYYGQNKKQ